MPVGTLSSACPDHCHDEIHLHLCIVVYGDTWEEVGRFQHRGGVEP
jgi:hypothetical protein